MENFLKGIVAGIGGVAPGLNGSVLLIIFGLYQKILEALATILTKFKKNVKFLLPIAVGMIVGVLLFSKVIDFLLSNYEMQTRYCFLGLILGTIPLLFNETKKNGFSKKYYLVIIISAVVGIFMFTLNPNANGQIINPTIINSITLGIIVAITAIVPGVEPTVLLSTLGYYELYVKSLASIDLTILLPMLIGLAIGAIVISYIITKLFKHFYTMTYSIIFGSFLSMIPNILNESCKLGMNTETFISLMLVVIGFIVSYYLGNIKPTKKRKYKKRSKKK